MNQAKHLRMFVILNSSYNPQLVSRMGKHNGKARKLGAPVGMSLINKARRDGRNGTATSYLHTTDPGPSHNMQSVLEGSDLAEIMEMVSTRLAFFPCHCSLHAPIGAATDSS